MPTDTAGRVARSHAQTRRTITVALVVLAASAAMAAWSAWRHWESGRWTSVHLFLVGGVTLAISAVSVMLTVTWSAAPAPSDRVVAVQRWSVAVGAVVVTVGRAADLGDGVTTAGAALYGAGLLVLGVVLVTAAHRGSQGRFRPAVVAYVAAIASVIVGATVGAVMATTAASTTQRGAHVTLNLLGFVGVTIGGTLPFFASTVGRSKMSRAATPRRLVTITVVQSAAAATAAAALAASAPTVAGVAVGAYAAGVVATAAVMPRPTARTLRWAGPRLVALWAGVAWWVSAVVATAVDAVTERPVMGGRWLVVLVVGAYAQILWGSLAYLLPMLRGGGHVALSDGFALTRSWPGLVFLNACAVFAAARWGSAALVAGAVWFLDTAWRTARVGTRRLERPAEKTG